MFVLVMKALPASPGGVPSPLVASLACSDGLMGSGAAAACVGVCVCPYVFVCLCKFVCLCVCASLCVCMYACVMCMCAWFVSAVVVFDH